MFVAGLVSSQPTSCIAHELPFSVANAVQITSISIEALYTLIGETPCNNLTLSVCKALIVLLLKNIARKFKGVRKYERLR